MAAALRGARKSNSPWRSSLRLAGSASASSSGFARSAYSISSRLLMGNSMACGPRRISFWPSSMPNSDVPVGSYIFSGIGLEGSAFLGAGAGAALGAAGLAFSSASRRRLKSSASALRAASSSAVSAATCGSALGSALGSTLGSTLGSAFGLAGALAFRSALSSVSRSSFFCAICSSSASHLTRAGEFVAGIRPAFVSSFCCAASSARTSS